YRLLGFAIGLGPGIEAFHLFVGHRAVLAEARQGFRRCDLGHTTHEGGCDDHGANPPESG
ncbi:MAG: hypothetical protein J0H60_01995, partial [Rhizobiales bacterium]|nr:hypothetical protein [Hyphomicrobiales bacterium]